MGDGGPGCRDARYPTIQAAVNAARPGDLIPVCPGRYTEAVRVGTPRLKIFSRVRHAAVVQLPDSPNTYDAGFLLRAGGTLVRGFTILPSEGSCEPSDLAVEALGSGTLERNRIMGSGCHRLNEGIVSGFPEIPGIFAVDRNEISGVAGRAVGAGGGRAAINHNKIRGGYFGIALFGGRSVVQANNIKGATDAGIIGDGFDAGDRFNLWVAGNRLRHNGRGIVAQYFGVGSPDPVGLALRIQANTVLDSVGDGILVELGPRGLVTRNRSLGNGGFDCVQRHGGPTWKDNIGVTDSPSNLCRAP